MAEGALIAFGLSLAVLAVLVVLAPTWLLLVALATLAIGPEWIYVAQYGSFTYAGIEVASLHKAVLLFAVIANMLRYGVRLWMSWPVAALVVILVCNKLFGNLHPPLGTGQMIKTFVALAMPWVFLHVVLERGTRWRYAAVICMLPILSVAIGAVLDAGGIWAMYSIEFTGAFRLRGAGIPAALGFLAFFGIAVALHEAVREPDRPKRAILLTVVIAANLVILALSGARMAIGATVVLVLVYVLASRDLRRLIGRRGLTVFVGGGTGLMLLSFYLPVLGQRFFGGLNPDGSRQALNMSSRDVVWDFFWEQFLLSPIFGRGIGSAATGPQGLAGVIGVAPHNEYLRLLVEGGVVGLALYLIAIAMILIRLCRHVDRKDRVFVVALFVSLAVFAFTDNVLGAPAAMPIYAYLGVMLIRSPAPVPAHRHPAPDLGIAKPLPTIGPSRTCARPAFMPREESR